MSITRRQILKGALGGAGVLALGGGLGNYIFRKYLSDNYLQAQLGGIPLIYSDSSRDFNPSISLSAAAGYFKSDEVLKDIKNYFKVLFFAPDGKLVLNKEYILNSFDHHLVPFENLGWGSVIVASAVPEDPKQLPQIDAVSTFTHRTPFGEDGHHLQAIREKNKRSSHVILSPNEDEERLIAFFNPSPSTISGVIELFDESGLVVFSQATEWGAFQTKYLALGTSVIKPPDALQFLSFGRKPLLVNVKGAGTGVLLTSSWHFRAKDNPYFTQAHGANFSLFDNSGVDVNEPATLEEFKRVKHISEVYKRMDIFPGDFCCHSEQSWAAKVTIPNVTNYTIHAGLFISDSNGNIVANSFASKGAIKIEPNSLKQIDIESLLEEKDRNHVYALNCYVGANLYSSYSLTKPVIIDEKNRLLFQHLRPHDLPIKGEQLAHYLKSTNEQVTDYWIGNIDVRSTTEIISLIRNNGTTDEDQGRLIIFSDQELLTKIDLPPISKNGFILQKIEIAESLNNKVGVRVTGPVGNLTISLLFKDKSGNYSIRHGSSKCNRYPNTTNLNKAIPV